MSSCDSHEERDSQDSNEKLLPREDQDEELLTYTSKLRKATRRQKWERVWHVAIEVILLAAVIVLVATERSRSWYNSQVVYTPASEVIKYEERKFTAGYLPGEKSKYQLDCPECHPTDAIDEAWESLYSGIMWSAIPRSDAVQLRNKTINIPSRPDHYLIGLDVFHQLHCLDNVRKAMWPERYNPDELMGGQGMSLLSRKHVDHCIDQIRQSIMCQSDLTPNWLRWEPAFGTHLAARDIVHSCRNFEAVQDWARERVQEPFDLAIRIPDPLKDG